jgi:hypothetical protein
MHGHDSKHKPLNEFNNSPLNAERLRLVWPHHLGQLLECTEVHNHAFALASNDRIVRKTIDFFINRLDEDLSDWLVVIQWTDPSRFEFYDRVSKSWALVSNQIAITENSRIIGEQEASLIKSCYKFQSYTDYNTKFFNQVLQLGGFFKSHGIKYVFVSMDLYDLDTVHKGYLNQNFVWYNNDIDSAAIRHMGVEIDCGKIECFGHPTEKAYHDIADNIFSFVGKK